MVKACERSQWLYVAKQRQRNRSVAILPGLYTVSEYVSVSHPCPDSRFQSDKQAHTPLTRRTLRDLSPHTSTGCACKTFTISECESCLRDPRWRKARNTASPSLTQTRSRLREHLCGKSCQGQQIQTNISQINWVMGMLPCLFPHQLKSSGTETSLPSKQARHDFDVKEASVSEFQSARVLRVS